MDDIQLNVAKIKVTSANTHRGLQVKIVGWPNFWGEDEAPQFTCEDWGAKGDGV